MARHEAPRIAIAPAAAPAWMTEAVEEGGRSRRAVGRGRGPDLGRRPPRPTACARPSTRDVTSRWVQLPFAGIEHFVHLLDDEHVWVVRQGRVRRAGRRVGARRSGSPGCAGSARTPGRRRGPRRSGRNLLGARVTHPRRRRHHRVARAAARSRSTATSRSCASTASDMDGVDDVLEADRYADALPGADLVVLALALTAETEGIIGRRRARP